MRIAHVLRRLSFNDWGGTEQVVWNLAKAQKAAGHEVRLFATTALWNGDSLATKNAKTLCPLCSLWLKKPFVETVDGIEILRFKPIYPWWPMPKSIVDELDRKGGNPFMPGLGKALRDWHPDVIHCHAMARIAELCLRTAKALTSHPSPLTPHPSTKCIISLHGGGANVPGVEAKSLMAPTRGRFPWGKLIDYAMGWTRRIPEDADGIVCVGEDEYLHYKDRHPHVMYLPNGVDVGLFQSPHPSPLTPHPSPPQPSTLNPQPLTTLLCLARIDRQKNQMMLVEALARHPDLTVRLVGPVTQPDYRAELEHRAAELGVADRLVFVGALKPGSPELISEYRSANLFVLPSRHEPFGIVVLEAWAAGVPVVASNVGGLGKLCAAHPEAALTFPCDDAVALDAALQRILSDAALRAQMVQAGMEAALTYDWRSLGISLVDFYAQT